MAETTLTHIEDFTQEISNPIPVLRELEIWKRALYKHTWQTLRAARAADERRRMGKDFLMIERKGSPLSYPFLL